MEYNALRPGYRVSRVIGGGWQLAGGHGEVDRAAAVADLVASAEAGITTFDCADIYTGVEELIGAARRAYADRHGADGDRDQQVFADLGLMDAGRPAGRQRGGDPGHGLGRHKGRRGGRDRHSGEKLHGTPRLDDWPP